MKRIVCFCLLIAMLLGSFVCEATESPTVTLREEISNDDKVHVSLVITENSHACGGSFNITYDREVLALDSCTAGGLIENQSAMVNPEYANGVIRATWAGTEALSTGGVLFALVFTPVKNGAFSTKIEISRAKLADENSEKIECTVVSCDVSRTANTPNLPISGGQSQGGEQIAPLVPFQDVPQTAWFYESVKFAFDNKLMNGVTATKFAPDSLLTRAMFVTIIYRLEGEPAAPELHFRDVSETAYYAKAVAWASSMGIVTGVSADQFRPDNEITREQMAAILYRLANYQKRDVSASVSLTTFSDAGEISDYAKTPMLWANAKGLIQGRTATMLAPKGTATRAETATILMRYSKNIG